MTFLNDTMNGFLELIYPTNCVVCDKELNAQEKNICITCLNDLHFTYYEKYTEPTFPEELFLGRIKLAHVYSLLYYDQNNSTQAILHKIKYGEGKGLGRSMGKLMGQKLGEQKWLNDIDSIVPIPLHSKKAFKRGYNQSLLIAEGLSEQTEIPIVEGLSRKRHHESQTKKSKDERWENVKSIFTSDEQSFKGKKHILIVDDVLTTGSTLESAAHTILEQYPNLKISLATIAIAK